MLKMSLNMEYLYHRITNFKHDWLLSLHDVIDQLVINLMMKTLGNKIIYPINCHHRL